MTLQLFMKFVINGSRSTSTKTLQLLWDIIEIDSMIPIEQTVDCFFLLLLEFSGCDPNGIKTTAARLSNQIRNYALKNISSNNNNDVNNNNTNNNNNTIINSKVLINWTNEYAPHAHKVFVSYLNDKCFHNVELIGYTPFRPPILENGSSVLNQSDVVPLALYDINLQGRWKQLYTTQTDGLSFNRIAHHILGYSVSLTNLHINISLFYLSLI